MISEPTNEVLLGTNVLLVVVDLKDVDVDDLVWQVLEYVLLEPANHTPACQVAMKLFEVLSSTVIPTPWSHLWSAIPCSETRERWVVLRQEHVEYTP